MKQRITVEQLQELSEEQGGRLREWWRPVAGDYFTALFSGTPLNRVISNVSKRYEGQIRDSHCNVWEIADCLPLLSIGQCIELGYFLGIHADLTIPLYQDKDYPLTWYPGRKEEPIEIIDALWGAIKTRI